MAEDQRHPFLGSRALHASAFYSGVARLVGRYFHHVSFAQIERDHLFAEALTQLDFDRIQKRAAAPVVVTRGQYQFFTRVPAVDGEGPAANNFPARTFGDAISRQRQDRGQIRRWSIALDDDRIASRKHLPFGIHGSQRCRHRIRTHRGSVMKCNSAPDVELPALIAGIDFPCR